LAKLQLNLASRPFINPRPLNLLVLVIAVGLGVGTFLNIHSLFRAVLAYRVLAAEQVAEEAAMRQAKREEAKLRKQTGTAEARRIRTMATEVASVIQRRQLSWSRLLDQLAIVLPADVRIMSINPTVQENQMWLVMECVARTEADMYEFFKKLNEPPFFDAVPVGKEPAGSQGVRFGIRCFYDPAGPSATTEEEPEEATSKTRTRRRAAARPATDDPKPAGMRGEVGS